MYNIFYRVNISYRQRVAV